MRDATEELLQAVETACRLKERVAENAGELARLVYLGIYAARSASLEEIEFFGGLRSHIDLGFVNSVIGRIAPAPRIERWQVVSRNGASTILSNGRIVARSGAADPEIAFAEVKRAGCSLFQSPGFISRLGERTPTGRQSRLYLALTPGMATWLLRDVHGALGRSAIPFAMKALSHPAAYFRVDAAVIYVGRGDLERTTELVRALLPPGKCLRRNTPLATCAIGQGIAWAEGVEADTGAATPLSFGQWVTGLILEAAQEFGPACSARDLHGLIRLRGRDPAAVHVNPVQARLAESAENPSAALV